MAKGSRERFMISRSVRFAENTMRPLLIPIAVVLLTNAPAGYAQDNPSTAGIHPPGDSGALMPAKAVKPSVANNGVATAGIHPPGQLGVVKSGQAVVVFPGQAPIALPGYPAVAVSGSTVGQALPASVMPTPIPGQPGLGSAMVNGRAAIIQIGTNRIVRYAE
jgi:hypothetical protein